MSLPASLLKLNPKTLKNKLCQRDLLEFIKKAYPPYIAGAVHIDICEELEQFSEDVVNGLSPRLMLFMPPRHGKSFIASENFPVWHIGNNPEHQCVVSSYSADLAQSFSKKALDLSQSEIMTEVFPKIVLDDKRQAMDNWGTTKGGGYKSVGVGGSLTGHGAHILIVDDPVKDWEDANSPRIREKVWNWWNSTAYTRLMPGGGVLIILTRWHEDDLAGRILDQMDTEKHNEDADVWKVIEYPAVAEEDEAHRKKGEPLHEERYPLSKLNKIRASVGERVWTSLYQQRPRPVTGHYIQSDWFNTIHPEDVPEELRWVRSWDLAVQAKASNDHTASSKMALDEKGNLYIASQEAYKKKWGESKRTICNTARREKIPIGIESVAAMMIAVEEVKMELRGEVIVTPINVSKDKLTRAIPWIDKAESGKVFLVKDARNDWIPRFIEQCEAFDPMQREQEDDLIDSVSLGYIMIKSRRKPRIFI